MKIEELISDVEKLLSEKRFRHSMGVMKLAVSLAERYGADAKKAAVAAILHDCAKEFDDDLMLKYFGMADTEDEVVKSSHKLWHGIAGAYFAREKYGIDDEIFDAIYYHTLGKKNMPLLTKIIYLADNIEETRDDSMEWAKELREKAHENIDEALLETINHTISYIIEKGYTIHPNAVLIRNEIILKPGE